MTIIYQDYVRLFPVTWTALLIGWRGFEFIGELIDVDDIKDFIYTHKTQQINVDNRVTALAIESELYRDDVCAYLVDLASEETIDHGECAQRWCALLLERLLAQLPNDYVDGLAELSSFWGQVGQPAWSPHVVQGVGNSLTPQEYYTEANFERMRQKNLEWAASILKTSQSRTTD